jgi:hypothetical protein
MNADGYRKFLKTRNLSPETAESAVDVVAALEDYLSTAGSSTSLEAATVEDVHAFSEKLIAEGGNTPEAYMALLRYGMFIKNRALYVTALEFLDGAEAFGNLYSRLGEEYGEAIRDRYFENVTVPPLGTPNTKKPALVQAVLDRFEAADPEACRRLLSHGLRDLQDEWFQDAKTEYESCRDLDEYLAKRAERFVAELAKHQAEGKWWFVQEITDEVIDFVRKHPEVASGVREGNVVYEAKIPYMAKEWLAETDPEMKRYYACHCPWVRESLRKGDVRVSPAFCQCSAAFHKKPWEIIFGQPVHAEVVESILRGDDRCRFAIHLPDSVEVREQAG